MANEAVFTEQLELSLDLDQLQSQLGDFLDMWSETIDKASEKSADIFNVADLGGLISALHQVGDAIGTLNQNFADMFSAIGSEAESASSHVEELQAQVDKAAASARAASEASSTSYEPMSPGGARRQARRSMMSGVSGEGTSILGSFFSGLTGGAQSAHEMLADTAQLVGVLGRWFLVWGAISTAIDAVKRGIKDIVNVFKEAFTGGFDYLERIDTNFVSLEQRVKDFGSHLEAVFAAPVFDRVRAGLQSVFDWLQKNQGKIDDFAYSLGEGFGEVYDAVKNLVSQNWDTVVGAFHTIADSVMTMATGLAQSVNAISALIEMNRKFDNSKFSVTVDNVMSRAMGMNVPKEVHDPALDNKSYSDIIKETQAKNDALARNLDDFIQGKYQKAPNIPFLPSGDALAAIKQQYLDTLAGLKAAEADYRQSTKTAMQDRTESVKQGTQDIIDSYHGELQAMQLVIDYYRNQMAKNGATPQQLTAFDTQAHRALNEAQNQANNGIESAIRERNKTLQSLEDEKNKTIEAAERDHTNRMVGLLKEQAQVGATTFEQAFKAEFQAKKDELNSQLVDLGTELSRNNGTEYWDVTKAKLDKVNEALNDLNATYDAGLNGAQAKDKERAVQIADEADQNRVKAIKDAQAASDQFAVTTAEKNKIDLDALRQEKDIMEQRKQLWQDFVTWLQNNDPNSPLVKQAQKALDSTRQSLEGITNQAARPGFFGYAVNPETEQTTGFFDKLNVGAKNLNDIFAQLHDTVDHVISAFRSGNIFAGVGAIAGGVGNIFQQVGQKGSAFNTLATDIFGSGSSIVGSVLPGLGAAFGVAGSLFGWIGQLFTEHARHIAEDVQKAFDAIVKKYEQGQASFSTTMADLQKERNDAIAQLSGQKGGKGYLTQILDQIDQETAQLQAASEQAQRQFVGNLDIMVRGVDKTAQQYLQNWQQILQQAHDYVYKYGGSPAVAGEFLNYSLFNNVIDMQQQFNQGAEKAVQDALQLNDLYDQRAKIQDEINKLTVKNNDSLERREAGAITTLKQYQDQKKALQDQLDQINENITVQGQIVDDEKHVYNLAYDTASLHREDAQLRVAAADYELQTYREIQAILKNLYPAGTNITGLATLSYPQLFNLLPQLLGQLGYGMDLSNFGYTGTSIFSNIGLGAVPAFGASAPASPSVVFQSGAITIHTNATDASGIASSLQDSISSEIGYRTRSGRFIGA